MKNILITGARGFVGRNLKEALSEQYRVFAPLHSELELLDYDALARYVEKNKIESVVHAAIHVPMFNGVEKEFFNDMQMFLNLEKLSAGLDKLLYFGSGAEFDKRFDITMVREEDWGRSIPVTEYGLAKYTMNRIARDSRNIYNLRLFGIFGKYELWQIKFLSNLCCKALFDLPLTVRKACRFDFLCIDDLAPVVSWFLENEPQFHDYNVCMGIPYELTDLTKMVNAIANKDLPIWVLSDGRNPEYTACADRLWNEIKRAPTPMNVALRHLYEWYELHQVEIDFNILQASQ